MEYKRSFFSLACTIYNLHAQPHQYIYTFRNLLFLQIVYLFFVLYILHWRLALLFGDSFIRSYGTYGYGLPVTLFILCRLLN